MVRACAAWLAVVLMVSTLPVQAAAPDYGQWDGVLMRNVRNGYVDYAGIQADPAYARFVTQLGTTRPEDIADRSAGLAFWINAYNALAVQGILNGSSPASVISRVTFFRRDAYRVLGSDLTLDQIEKERLAAYGDPRVHFAIVCASISCPRLAGRAYRPGTVEVQLAAGASAFINDSTRNRYDLPRKLALLSTIFDWYAADFAAQAGSVPAYLAGHVRDPALAEALRGDTMTLRYIPYDWNLNGTFKRAR